MELSFVTVTFSEEILLQKLQALSFARFVDTDCIEEIILILNENDGTALESRLAGEGVLDAYGDKKPLLKVLHREEVIRRRFGNRGWRNQQALKLAAARLVRGRYMVVLDSKNHFVRTVNGDSFVGRDGRPYSFVRNYRSVMQREFRLSMRLFGIDPEAHVHRSLPVITPYVMYPRLVTDLITELDRTYGKDFLFRAFLDEEKFLTEFFLYMSFLLSRGYAFEDLYLLRTSFVATILKYTIINGDAPETIERARRDDVHAIGLHRRALPLLDARLKQEIVALWCEAGLFADRDLAAEAMAALVSTCQTATS